MQTPATNNYQGWQMNPALAGVRVLPVHYRLLIILLVVFFAQREAAGSSLRFFGNGTNDIDRIKIQIDDPATNNPGPPADVGSSDFTIEFWVRPDAGNSAGPTGCSQDNSWINGNIIIDRDRFNQGRNYGISLAGGAVAFGVMNEAGTARTICGFSDLRGNQWHHIAVQRRRSDGFMWLFVDGVAEAQADGPDGDISYPDDGVPGNFCGGPCTNSDPFIVIGAEKHDAGAAFPSYSGWVDEIRYSSALRYTGNFTPPVQAFIPGADVVALYHFDEGAGDVINDSSGAVGASNDGVRKFGGTPAGPQWSVDSPFAVLPPVAGNLQFAATASAAGEGDGSAVITVKRMDGDAGMVTVDYSSSNGTAMTGVDYDSVMGTLSWLDGDTTAQTFIVPLVDDTAVEDDETVNLVLSNPTGNSALGNPSAMVLTIVDDDTDAGSGGSGGSGEDSGSGGGGGCSTGSGEGPVPVSLILLVLIGALKTLNPNRKFSA